MITHDENYSLLFDHREMVEELLREIVTSDWLGHIRWETLHKEDAKLQSSILHGDIKRRITDRLWSAQLTEGGECFFLLIEFQSSVDHHMIFRIHLYVAFILDLLARTGRVSSDGKVPPIMPVVIYNGAGKWWAPTHLKDAIDLVPGHPLWRWQPSLAYYVIEQEGYGADTPLEARGLLSLIFAIDTATTRGELSSLLKGLGDALRDTPPGLRRSILDWLKNCAAGVGFGIDRLPESGDEVRSMLAERIQEWTKELKEEGRVEGRAEGRLEAKLRLLRENLQYLTALKCGEETWQRLSGPILAIEDPETLEALFKDALATSSPEELMTLLSKG